jgi:uncharacterized protein YecT (DUF1311 family)
MDDVIAESTAAAGTRRAGHAGARPTLLPCRFWLGVGLALAAPAAVSADPSLECGLDAASQVEIGACLAAVEATVDRAVDLALGFAADEARGLDEVTGRTVAAPALEQAQAAWATYRDDHCAYVGATFGGGSGTGIAIRSCRIELGRERVEALMRSLP